VAPLSELSQGLQVPKEGQQECVRGRGGWRWNVCFESCGTIVSGLFARESILDEHSAICQNCPGADPFATAGVTSIFVVVVFGGGLLYFLHEQQASKFDVISIPLRRWVHKAKESARDIGLISKIKIFLTFAQVISTLDRTYSLQMPESWSNCTAFWRVIGDIDWVSWFVPAECLMGHGMVRQLCVRALVPLTIVVAVPLLGGAASSFQRFFVKEERHRSFGSDDAGVARFSGGAMVKGILEYLPASLVLAFCFTPSVSASIFQAWYCIAYAYDEMKEQSFLAQDPSVQCDGSDEHNKILAVAWVLVCIWPVGMIVMYVSLLIPCREMLLSRASTTPLLRATAFLHRDYKPPYYWWEVASLLQRTVLTGWLLLISAEQQFLRLLAALIISIAFLVAILACSPHKRKFDAGMAAGAQVLFVCLFMGGIMVRLYEDIANDAVGSPALAYRFLGLRSSDEAIYLMIVIAFAMVALLSFTLVGECYMLQVQQRLESKWSVCTIDPPHTNWKPRNIYAGFLSHYKMEAASDARYIHDMLRKMLQAPVFLDSSALKDMRDLITEGVHKSDTLVLLATGGVLTRPWCLLELLETKRKRIPVIIVTMANSGFTFDGARLFIEDFEAEMARVNPPGLDFLTQRFGSDMDEIKEAVEKALESNESAQLTFDAHAGDHAMLATMKDVVERMAKDTGRTIKWSGGEDLLRGAASSRAASRRNTFCRKETCSKTQLAAFLKDLGGRTSRTSKPSERDSVRKNSLTKRIRNSLTMHREEVVVNKGSAVFVCCARRDAVRHARVLRAGLSIKIGRGCAIGGGDATARFIEVSHLCVVLLTKKLLSDPIALHEIWLAVRQKLPLVTCMITGCGYDYDNASALFADLSTGLEKAKPGAAQELQEQLPDGVSVDDVGQTLKSSLTAIIALSWSPASRNQLDAVVDDIVASIPKSPTRRRGSSRTDAFHPGAKSPKSWPSMSDILAIKYEKSECVQIKSSRIDVTTESSMHESVRSSAHESVRSSVGSRPASAAECEEDDL